jgi:hypothetical protein
LFARNSSGTRLPSWLCASKLSSSSLATTLQQQQQGMHGLKLKKWCTQAGKAVSGGLESSLCIVLCKASKRALDTCETCSKPLPACA